MITLLAKRYHMIAPDFPGFGHSDAPPPPGYDYTFDHLATTTDHFLEKLGLTGCSLCIHDYDLPDAEIHLLDAGHFAMDEKNDEIAALVLGFMAAHVPP